jgi:hypothetical protein
MGDRQAQKRDTGFELEVSSKHLTAVGKLSA